MRKSIALSHVYNKHEGQQPVNVEQHTVWDGGGVTATLASLYGNIRKNWTMCCRSLIGKNI